MGRKLSWTIDWVKQQETEDTDAGPLRWVRGLCNHLEAAQLFFVKYEAGFQLTNLGKGVKGMRAQAQGGRECGRRGEWEHG